MATQAIVTLESLHCTRESDRGGSSHSEPYIWPFLASVTSNSFETTPTAAILSDSRAIIRNEMRAGQSAAIPGPGNRLSAVFQDGQANPKLLLVVALWEADETPASAVQAGNQAFLDELRAQVSKNLAALSTATDAERKTIVEDIKKKVYDKVHAAVENKLSSWEKTRVFLGWLNLDDFMGSDFKLLPDLTPTSFTLTFLGNAGDVIFQNPGGVPPKVVNPPIQYELRGSLKVQAVTVDVCQAQVDAVNAAQAKLKGLQDMVQSLQAQLQHATPQQKSGIVAQIRQINEHQIPQAQKALDEARSALEACRASHTRRPPVPPVVPPIVR